ncbi:MAG: hypothetical protein ABSG83_02610 [Roseiarcus sp.]|jgi:hypothetical protein
MVRHIIEQIELLHSAGSMRLDRSRSERIDRALADCLQALRAIVASEARDRAGRRPPLRIV